MIFLQQMLKQALRDTKLPLNRIVGLNSYLSSASKFYLEPYLSQPDKQELRPLLLLSISHKENGQKGLKVATESLICSKALLSFST